MNECEMICEVGKIVVEPKMNELTKVPKHVNFTPNNCSFKLYCFALTNNTVPFLVVLSLINI